MILRTEPSPLELPGYLLDLSYRGLDVELIKIIVSLVILAGCSAPQVEPNYDYDRLERRVTDLTNRVAILEIQNSSLSSRVSTLQGTSDSCTDNYIGLKLKMDMLARDLCPACTFDNPKIREPRGKEPKAPSEPQDDRIPLD